MLRMGLIILAIGFLLPQLVQSFRSEVGGWLHARGFEAELEQDLSQAEAFYRRALAWDPQHARAQQSLTGLLVRGGRADETLDAAAEQLEMARALYKSQPTLRHRGALISALNQSAYFCALANVDLETALERIDEAIALFGQPADASLIDTRGYVLWRLERYDEALEEMNLAVDTNKHRYLADHRIVKQRGSFIVDERVADRLLTSIDERMATLYYHRALVNEALDKADLAERDLERVRNLGFDPEAGLF